MIGDWIAAVSRRMLRDDTFALIAAPAVTDYPLPTAY